MYICTRQVVIECCKYCWELPHMVHGTCEDPIWQWHIYTVGKSPPSSAAIWEPLLGGAQTRADKQSMIATPAKVAANPC